MRSTPIRIVAQNLTAQVIEHLRHDLLSGRFAPGTRLNEVELAAEFEISRGPLREAVQCLVSEGLVEHRPNRGAIVPVPTAASVTGLFELRHALEVGVVRLACQRRSEEDLVALAELCVATPTFLAPGERMPYGLDLAFHDRLIAAAGSPLLATQTRRVLRQVVLARASLSVPETHTHASMADHEEIVARVQAHDARGAEQLVERHLQLVLDHLLASLPA